MRLTLGFRGAQQSGASLVTHCYAFIVSRTTRFHILVVDQNQG